MDEVQMVGEQTSKASLTCALIARKFSLAVSGTPLLDKIEHSQPLLKFLQIEPLGSSSSMMRRFLKDRPLFERVLGELGERTTKSEVKNELTIPAQTRFLVPVEFEAVEKYFYDGQYMAALEELGFDLQTGAPIEKVDADGVEIPWVADKQVMVSHPLYCRSSSRTRIEFERPLILLCVESLVASPSIALYPSSGRSERCQGQQRRSRSTRRESRNARQ